MGVLLARYFAVAKQKGGLPLQLKLAMRTCIPERRALEIPDSPENIKLFEDAMKELLGPLPGLFTGSSDKKSR